MLILFVDNIVGIMATPAQAIEGTKSYLVICFLGIPFITIYNIISSIFRGLGDSKSPMYFIAIACVTNIGLDYLFIGAMKIGPIGAALGTTISQSISVIVTLTVIMRQKVGFTLHRDDFKIKKKAICKVLNIGVPVALQDGFIQIAFLIITIIANQRGLNDAAAVGIVEKVVGMLFLVPSSMLSAVSALAAQNIGAGKYDRATKTLKYSILLCVGFGVVVTVAVQVWAEMILSLFSKETEVIFLGSQYFRGYIFDCIFAGVHFCYSGYFCACGKSSISFLHNSLSIVLARVPGAYFASKFFEQTLFPMGLAAAAGSLLSVVICITAYAIFKQREITVRE